MQVAVTGGTGFVGTEIVGLLRRQGHKVRVLGRHWRRADWIVDVTDPATLRPGPDGEGPFSGVDAVIHLVGILVEGRGASFEQVHRDGTANVLEAARLDGVKRFIHMSALGARADAPARYHRTKWQAEEAVRNSEMDWTLFRPSVIFGPRDAFLNLFATMAKWLPALALPGGGRARLQPIWVGDVAHCFCGALGDARTVGKAYDLGGSAEYTLKELVRKIVAARCRLPRLLLPLPYPLARLNALLMETLLKDPPLTREQLIMLKEGSVCDATEAAHDFNREWKSVDDYLAERFRP